jgi:hypothetical protein
VHFEARTASIKAIRARSFKMRALQLEPCTHCSWRSMRQTNIESAGRFQSIACEKLSFSSAQTAFLVLRNGRRIGIWEVLLCTLQQKGASWKNSQQNLQARCLHRPAALESLARPYRPLACAAFLCCQDLKNGSSLSEIRTQAGRRSERQTGDRDGEDRKEPKYPRRRAFGLALLLSTLKGTLEGRASGYVSLQPWSEIQLHQLHLLLTKLG